MGRSLRFAAAALAGSVALTACQGSTGTPATAPAGTPTTAPAGTPTTAPHPTAAGGTGTAGRGQATSSALLTTRAAQAAVEGRDYTTLYTVAGHGSSVAGVGVLTIRNDGSAVIVKDPPSAGEVISQSQVGLQSIDSSRTLLPPQTGSAPRQAIEAAADGQSFVWLETKSTDLFYQDWRVFAARVGQRQPTLLGDSFALTKTDEVPPPPGVRVMTTDGVHAWWTMTYRSKSQPQGWGARIMVRDIAGREPLTTAVDRAKLPAATGEGIAYVRSKDVDPSAPANRYDIRLHQAGADTWVTSGPLVKDEQVSTMCASDTLIAWAVRSPEPLADTPPEHSTGGRLHVMSLATKVQQTIELDDDAGSLDLSCGGTFVAWGNGSGNGDPGQYVLDAASGKLWKLGESPGISSTYAAGTMLGWTLPPKGSQETAPVRVTRWHGR